MADLLVSSPNSSASTVTANEPAILQKISSKDYNLAIWKRSLAMNYAGLLDSNIENVRVTVPASDPETMLRSEMDQCGFPKSAASAFLIEDILDLCELFGKTVHYPKIEIRVELVTGNSCWKFHSDYVEIRLITTYIGRGTQWIDQYDIDRISDGLEPLDINELEPGDVGLFKGKLNNNQPVIHRSPPIDGSGEKRLLLVLNPVKD
ncbi:MAG: DUF1826 domain-containing protein [Parasphingorhabdus sp.]|uniref:DUF1826 domain-containing protein n=1 Tax=Parasphingorhabdus sp. TaxID=2709688 RepID=UPI003299D245